MSDSSAFPKLTVGIATRNRPETLARCVRSVALIAELVDEIIIVDDASDSPIEEPLRKTLGDFPLGITVLRQAENQGQTVARNRIARVAANDFILSLDDDAFVLDADGVIESLRIMMGDDRVAVVAFAQANEDATTWPEYMQPAPVKYPCQVPTFIGYAYLMRRETFAALKGFRDAYFYMGEETEYCLRLLEAGYKVVFLPNAKAGHLAVSAERNDARFARLIARNSCLSSLYNEPLLMMLASVPFRLYGYLRMRQGLKVKDPEGFRWVLQQLYRSLPEVWRERKPVRWSTIFEWRRLRRDWPRYPASETE